MGLFTPFLTLANTIINVLQQDAAQEREQERLDRKNIAKLFEQISQCLATVSSEIRMNRIPRGKCKELNEYANQLPKLLMNMGVDDKKAKQLGKKLNAAHAVEAAAVLIHDRGGNKEPDLKAIDEAAGKFQALANMVRAGSLGPSEPTRRNAT